MHVDALRTSEYFPAGQSVHTPVVLIGLYFPTTQAEQVPFVPVQPALQTQDVMSPPCGEVYEFAGHITHCDRSLVEYEPASQLTQLTAVVLEYLPAPQPVHSADPLLNLYFPATHGVHTPFAPVQPGLHLHPVSDVLATCEFEFCGQLRHTVLLSSEYKPASQSLHVSVDAFMTREYFPAAQ